VTLKGQGHGINMPGAIILKTAGGKR